MKLKLIIGLILLCLIVIFIVQNTEVVSIQFLFMTISMSRALMILFVLAVGVILGWIGGTLAGRKAPDKS